MSSLLRWARTIVSRPSSESRTTAGLLDVLWRLLQAPRLWYGAVAAGTLLVLSTLVFPRAYIPADNAFGWPTDLWPSGYQRLVALLLVGSAPWAKVVLVALAVLSAVRASDTLRAGDSPSEEFDVRTPLYAEATEDTALFRCRIASAAIGSRLQPVDGQPGVFRVTSYWAGVASRLGLSLTLVVLSLLLLAAPKVSAAEVLNLEPGYSAASAAAGLTVSAGQDTPPVVELENGAGAIELNRSQPIRLADMWFGWHGRGPALSVSPNDGEAAEETLVIPFLPDKSSKYIALPGAAVSLRASIENGAFQVQPLNRQGLPAGDPYQVTGPTEVPLSGVLLALSPSHYMIISIARLPLWLATGLALAALPAFLVLSRLQGPPLRLAVRGQSGVTAIEAETSSSSLRHRLWLRLLKALLS